MPSAHSTSMRPSLMEMVEIHPCQAHRQDEPSFTCIVTYIPTAMACAEVSSPTPETRTPHPPKLGDIGSSAGVSQSRERTILQLPGRFSAILATGRPESRSMSGDRRRYLFQELHTITQGSISEDVRTSAMDTPVLDPVAVLPGREAFHRV